MTTRTSWQPSGPWSTTSSMLDRITRISAVPVALYTRSRNLVTFLISFWLIRLHVL